MSLVLEDDHGIRGLLLRARASDSRFALSSPGAATQDRGTVFQTVGAVISVIAEGNNHGGVAPALRWNGYQ